MATEMTDAELHKRLNEYAIKNHIEDKAIYHNLKIFYYLSAKLLSNLSEFESLKFTEKYENRATLFQIIELIKEFYKEHGIDLSVDRCINDGTIDIKFRECLKEEPPLSGLSNVLDGHKSIAVTNNGLVIDASVLVHELSHFRNQENSPELQVHSILTESVAFADELIFFDFLSQKGYEEDTRQLMIGTLNSCYYVSLRGIISFSIMEVFNSFGLITEDNYKLIFDDSALFNINLNAFKSNLESYLEGFDKLAQYVLGYALAFYMYQEYKKDPKFYKNIQQLNKAINSKNVTDCLSIIGLSDLDDDDFDKIIEALNQIKSELGIDKIANVG